MTCTGRAFGKVILLGEHAVVHGTAALAASIDRGATATASLARSGELRLGERTVRIGDTSGEAQAFASLCGALGLDGVSAKVELDLPAGVGLGASAAVGVALARAIAGLREQPPSEAAILDAAARWEQVFHGKASGVDAAAAAGGGLIKFRRPHSIERLNADHLPSLLIGVSGPAASTKLMVERVATFANDQPEQFGRILEAIETLVQNASTATECGDSVTLGVLMNENQQLLCELGVSTPALDAACAAAVGAGALGAKLTGAGGGGCVVAVADGEGSKSVLGAWQARGIRAFEARIASVV